MVVDTILLMYMTQESIMREVHEKYIVHKITCYYLEGFFYIYDIFSRCKHIYNYKDTRRAQTSPKTKCRIPQR